MEKIKEYWYYGIAILVLIICILFGILISKKEDVAMESIDIPLEEEVVSEENIKIDIKGAVVTPGVHTLPKDSRVEDAILSSGGLLESADTSRINLSKKLQDEMVIIVYTKEEIEAMKQENTAGKLVEQECICPVIENSGCPSNVVTNYEEAEDTEKTQEKISLNTASLEELTTLTGIGPSKAQSIIEYRNQNGGFKSIEEIKNVKGIGDAVYEKIKEDLTL